MSPDDEYRWCNLWTQFGVRGTVRKACKEMSNQEPHVTLIAAAAACRDSQYMANNKLCYRESRDIFSERWKAACLRHIDCRKIDAKMKYKSFMAFLTLSLSRTQTLFFAANKGRFGCLLQFIFLSVSRRFCAFFPLASRTLAFNEHSIDFDAKNGRLFHH